jgi:hypothetical protein
MQEQVERIAALEKQLASLAQAAAAANRQLGLREDVELLENQMGAIADSANETQQRVSKVSSDLAAAQRNYDGKFRQLGNFRFSGDARYRYEPFFQHGQTTRQRQRVRLRFNVQGNVSDTLYGGLSIATGSLDDPISTNQTLTGFFNRKNIGIDRAWIQWTPRKVLRGHATFGLGKFSYPWIRTPLTFDSDLNPEGIYSRWNWDFKNPVFKGFTVVGMVLPYFERGGSTSPTSGRRADGYDAFAAGAQIQTRWKFGERLTFGTSIAALNFVNVDFIAQAHSSSAVTASLSNNLTGNQPNTNCVRTNASQQVVGYCSRFAYLDWITSLNINTGRARWPVNLLFDFNNNVRATHNIQIGTAGLTGRVDNPERSAYWAEITVGRQQESKDWQFGYSFARVERDAVITAFNESDLRAGSNLSQNRLNVSYRAYNNVTLSYTLWLGHIVNANDPFTGTGGAIALVPGGKRAIPGGSCSVAPFDGCTDNMLKRMQLDLIYTF